MIYQTQQYIEHDTLTVYYNTLYSNPISSYLDTYIPSQ